jgi:hypothetical protein
MANRVDLEAIEKKAYRSYFMDGIWDIFIGMIFLNLGIGPLLILLSILPSIWNIIIISLGWNIFAFLIFYLGKKYITIPRIGFVKFGPKREAKRIKLKIFLFGIFMINLILFILRITGIIDYTYIERFLYTLLIGLGMFIFPFSLMAYFLDFTRLYFYAFSAGIGFILTEYIKQIVGYPLGSIIIFGCIGGIIVAIGLSYFILFIRKYPIPKVLHEKEVPDG